MKRIAQLFALLVVVIGGIMSWRAVKAAAPPMAAAATAQVDVAVDTMGAARRLSGALQHATVVFASGGAIDTAVFRRMHSYIDSSYPNVAKTLTREVVGGLSLLYTWRGADTALAPVVIMGHFDVVPVTEENRSQWTHDPFSGDIDSGFVWGRGALDDKSTVFSALEAVEQQIAAGVQPARTVYLTFGHDEEVGGRYGARAIVDTLVARGVKPALVLDEGGFMGSGILPGIEGPAAVIGIAEKGYVSLRITAVAEGGHSSMPTERTAVGALSRAVAKLEANPFPMKLEGATLGMLESMTPWLPFSQRLAMANLWIARPLVTKALASNPLGAALMHTTTAPTMLTAGVKDNVLPPEATAVVNFRILPGETVASVKERVTRVVADSQVRVVLLDSVAVDPSPVSSTNVPAFQLLQSVIQSMQGGASVPVIPYVVMGGTDAKYWGPHSDRVYRFLPVPLGDGDRARVHGVNERIRIQDFATSVAFFVRLFNGLTTL